MRLVCGLFVLPGSIKISIAIFQMVLYLLTIITYFLHFSIPFSPFYFRLKSILKPSSSFFIPLKIFHYCFLENRRIKLNFGPLNFGMKHFLSHLTQSRREIFPNISSTKSYLLQSRRVLGHSKNMVA